MRIPDLPVEKTAAPRSRPVDILAAVLLAVAFASIQVLIGGTRLLFSLPAYAVLALMSFVTLFSLTRARPRPSQICLLSAAVFFGYILIRALLSDGEYLARADIYSVLGGLMVYLFVACFFTDAKQRISLLFFLLALALAHVCVGVVQFKNADNFMLIPGLKRYDYEWRASGFYVCPNHLAGLLEVIGVFGLSIAFWSRYPTWVKLLVGYAAGVCYFGMLLTGSRGGYLSSLTSLLIFVVLSLWISRGIGAGTFWRIGAGVAVLALVMALAVMFGLRRNANLSGRAHTIADTENMRVDLWRAAIQQWKLAPAFGTGSGTYLYYGRMFRTDKMQLDPIRAHNDYLDLLAEYGCVGAATFLLFFAAHFRSGWRNLTRLGPKRVAVSGRLASNGLALQLGAIAAVGAYVVHSIFDFNLHIPANVLLLAFVFGILVNPGPQGQESVHRPKWSIVLWRLLLPGIGVVIVIQCLRLLPGEYFAERARTALRHEHAGTTIRFVERALQTEQKNPNLYDYLGRAQLMRGDARSEPEEKAWFYRQALAAFQKGRKLAPLDEDFALQLGHSYDLLGRFAEAEWMYYEALQLDPRSIWAKQFYREHLDRWRDSGAGVPPPPSVPPS